MTSELAKDSKYNWKNDKGPFQIVSHTNYNLIV
jgi:hypothetical protein